MRDAGPAPQQALSAAADPGAPQPPHGVWWLSPPGAVSLVVPLTLLLAVRFDDAHYRLAYRTPKSLTDGTAELFAAGGLLFVLGALASMAVRAPGRQAVWPDFSAPQLATLRRASDVLFALTMTGYVGFALVGLARGARPAQFLQAATSQDNFGSPLRDEFAPVAGVTTLTQVGIAYVVVGLLLRTRRADERVPRRLAVVLVLALLRTFFLAERLAVLELAIPGVAVLALSAAAGGRQRTRRLVRLAPVLLVPAVVVVFSVFEYSRSWVFYSRTAHGSFAGFAVDRLAGYYATAYNNGQLALSYDSGGPRLPYGSVEAFWTAPGVAQLGLYQRLTGLDPTQGFDTALAQHGNPEFNSPGGLAVPFVDYGHVGGLVFLLLAGLALGVLYVRCCDGASWAVLLYPVTVTGLFELPRYLYWGQGRLAPAVVALLVVHWRLQRSAVGPPARVPVPV